MAEPKHTSFSGRALSIALGLATLTALLTQQPGCLDRRDTQNSDPYVGRCARCHGDANRDGDFLQRSAPPRDTSGLTEVANPSVGAHQNHVYASETHGPVACNECHVVPERADSPGHADTGYPAELSFGAVAKTKDHQPYYDRNVQRCTDSWCHRESNARWTQPRSSTEACGSCHGLPPAAPHPQSDKCEACHAEVIDSQHKIIRPELHVDGKVQFEGGKCSYCHGEGDNNAPPLDTLGKSSTSAIGVGAHQIHVKGSASSRAVACTECHVVPEKVDDPGHANGLPADVNITGVATTSNHLPSWDRNATTCTNTWCHSPTPTSPKASPSWTNPVDAECTTCHGSPPAAPHPQSERCDGCHAEVIDSQHKIIRPELHVDGKVQFEGGKCSYCHGEGDNNAPPLDTLGNSSSSAIGVGAHQVHLTGGSSSRPLACNECHVVPEKVNDAGHANGLPAEVHLNGVSNSGGHNATWDRVAMTCWNSWCHNPLSASVSQSPIWTDPVDATCTTCHGYPPAVPHPQMTDCSRCHGQVISSDNMTFTNRNRHVDGTLDLNFDQSCNACHGSSSSNIAPPIDLSGSSSTTSQGVGAHQTHVLGTSRSRAVPCNECHVVPTAALDPGHIDTFLPAELTFSGAANAYGGTPVYSSGTCQQSSCHGAVFPLGHASGGANTTPSWTTVDGTQSACGTCHALPPPAPHPKLEFNPVCNTCHKNIDTDNTTFLHPELHVDGVVTFELP